MPRECRRSAEGAPREQIKLTAKMPSWANFKLFRPKSHPFLVQFGFNLGLNNLKFGRGSAEEVPMERQRSAEGVQRERRGSTEGAQREHRGSKSN